MNFLESVADHIFGAKIGRDYATQAESLLVGFITSNPDTTEDAAVAFVDTKSAAIIDSLVASIPALFRGALKNVVVKAEDAVIRALYNKVLAAISPKA